MNSPRTTIDTTSTPLGSLVQVRGGGTPRKAVPEYYTGSIPWVSPKDFKGDEIQDSEDHISERALKESAARLIPAGAVLVVLRSGVLKHRFPVAINRIPVAVNQDVKALICGPQVHAEFLAHFLRHHAPRILQRVRGTTADNIPLAVLVGLDVPLPTLPEQKRIAEILDKADGIRRKAILLAQSAADLLVAAFVSEFGACWSSGGKTTIGLAEILARGLRNGVSPSADGSVRKRVLTLSAITGHRFNRNASKEASFKDPPAQENSVFKKDFLICRGNGNLSLVGAAKFPPDDMPDTIFPDTMIAATIDTQIIDPDFLEFAWGSPFLRGQIERAARTTNGTYKVNQTAIENLMIPYPPFDAQKRFGELCKVQANLVDRLRAPYSGELFQSLALRAFQGRL